MRVIDGRFEFQLALVIEAEEHEAVVLGPGAG